MVPIGVSHISSWLQEIQSREWEERTKSKRTIWAWVKSKCKKRSYVTLHSLCIYRLTLAWISSENSTTHEEFWLILTGLSSLLLGSLSCRVVTSAIRCRLATRVTLRQLPSVSSFVQLSTGVLFQLLVTLSSQIQTLCLVSRQNRQRDRLLGEPPT